MNWIKLTENQPSEGQAIWYRYTSWPTERVSDFSYWKPEACIFDKHSLIWQPAQPPAPPPDESDKAFNEWLDCHRYDQWNTPDGGIKAAWNAGRDYERSRK